MNDIDLHLVSACCLFNYVFYLTLLHISTGISMTLLQSKDGIQFFTFEHNRDYQQVQFKFLDAVESMDPNNIVVKKCAQHFVVSKFEDDVVTFSIGLPQGFNIQLKHFILLQIYIYGYTYIVMIMNF